MSRRVRVNLTRGVCRNPWAHPSVVTGWAPVLFPRWDATVRYLRRVRHRLNSR